MDICKDMTAFEAVCLALEVFDEERMAQKEYDSIEQLVDDIPELAYTFKLIQGVQQQQVQIDEMIASNLKGWELNRIVRLDLTIMRVATYEMISSNLEVPRTVSLNEAIEIAKMYSDEKSAKFINGVLSNLVNG